MQRSKRLFYLYLLLTLFFSGLILYCYFGELFESPNTTFFGAEGDGLLTYYSSIYHVKYDSTFFHQEAINYPFGESVFFTGCQPILTNSIKLLKPLIDLSDQTIGITNLIMLMSIVLSAVILYLIFQKLKLPGFYSAICATAIAYLSPQIARLGGHFTLTYQFAIPGIIYLILLFAEKPSTAKSLLIALFVFLMASTHIYFFAFFSILLLYFFTHSFFIKSPFFSDWKNILKHLSIQIILPYLIIQILIHLGNDVWDRTGTPYGFLAYKSSPGGVFWPKQKPYFDWMTKLYSGENLEWEGVSYVGISASIFFLLFLFSKLKALAQKQKLNLIEISDNTNLNVLFAASFISLIISFGLPFILGLNNLLNYMGPIKQFRGIARFAWNFYYLINIVMVYVLYKNLSTKNNTSSKVIVCAMLPLLLFDAHRNIENIGSYLNNHSSLTNEKIDEDGLRKLDPKKYQAILPLPYFHIGSENMKFEPTDSPIEEWAFEVSIKTGIPLFAVHASRTSLSQTYACIPIALEPLAPFPFVSLLPSNKPFLIVTNGSNLSENQQRVLGKAKELFSTTRFHILELSIDSIKQIQKQYYFEVLREIDAKKLTQRVSSFLTNDSVRTWTFNDFEDRKSAKSFEGNGSLEGELSNKEFVIFEGKSPAVNNENKYIFSFWLANVKRDLYPRSMIKVAHEIGNNNGEKCKHTIAHKLIKSIVGEWALVEDTVIFNGTSDKVKISIFNKELIGSNPISIDNFLLRPVSTSLYNKENGSLWYNNRQLYLSH